MPPRPHTRCAAVVVHHSLWIQRPVCGREPAPLLRRQKGGGGVARAAVGRRAPCRTNEQQRCVAQPASKEAGLWLATCQLASCCDVCCAKGRHCAAVEEFFRLPPTHRRPISSRCLQAALVPCQAQPRMWAQRRLPPPPLQPGPARHPPTRQRRRQMEPPPLRLRPQSLRRRQSVCCGSGSLCGMSTGWQYMLKRRMEMEMAALSWCLPSCAPRPKSASM